MDMDDPNMEEVDAEEDELIYVGDADEFLEALESIYLATTVTPFTAYNLNN